MRHFSLRSASIQLRTSLGKSHGSWPAPLRQYTHSRQELSDFSRARPSWVSFAHQLLVKEPQFLENFMQLSLTDMLIEIRVFLLSGNRSGRANGPLMCARKKTTTYPMFHVLEKGLKMLRLDHIGL